MLSYHMLRIVFVGLTIQYERIPGMITKTILVEKDMDMDIIPYLVQSACHYDCSLRISEGNKEINMKGSRSSLANAIRFSSSSEKSEGS